MTVSRRLGNTSTYVSAIGLGAMPLSLEGRPTEPEALKVIYSFLENGGTFIDTANVYCRDDNDIGHNEALIRKALVSHDNSGNIIVATKGGLKRPKGGWLSDARPEWIRKSCDQSLKALDTECIFLYQLHAPDPVVPISDSVGEMVRLKDEGKIQHIGLSNVNIKELEIALGITSIISVQNRCNLFERKSFSKGLVARCKTENITFIAHSPVGGHFGHSQVAKNVLLNKIARKYAVSPYQIMLAWLLHQSDHILPIPGASKISSITDSLKSVDLKLDDDDLEQLENLDKTV